MKKTNLPRSPFSTPLSGAARETELRIRGIFQWKKQRPPLPFLALMAAAVLMCGGLVSCQAEEPAAPGPAKLSNEESAAVFQSSGNKVLDQLYIDHQFHLESDASQYVRKEMLATLEGEDGRYLAAAHFYDSAGHYALLLHMVNRDGHSIGQHYIINSSGGIPLAVPFEKDGVPHLLYIANGLDQDGPSGEAGVVRVDGKQFTWVWPVEGDILDQESQARPDYHAYWADHKALLAPGGVDIFDRVPASAPPYQDIIPLWAASHNEYFWPAPEEELPMPVYYKARAWLEKPLQEGFPISASDTARWQILSLEPVDGVYHDNRYTGSSAYQLEAQWELDPDRFLTATLLFDHGEGEILEASHVQAGTWAELHALDTDGHAKDAQELILEYYQERYNSTDQVYYASAQPEQVKQLDLRLEEPAFLGQANALGGAAGIYRVDSQQYNNDRRGGPLDFRPFASEYVSVFYDRQTEAPVRVQGSTPYAENKTPQAAADEIQYGLWRGEVSFYREGDPYLAGPGGFMTTFDSRKSLGECQVERLSDRPVRDRQNDWWERYVFDGYTVEVYRRSLISARIYQFQDSTPYYMETTRTDLSTRGGVRVGDSKEAVLDRYPAALEGDYYGRYPGENLLYYIPGGAGLPYEDSGPAILFFLDESGQTVERLALTAPFA